MDWLNFHLDLFTKDQCDVFSTIFWRSKTQDCGQYRNNEMYSTSLVNWFPCNILLHPHKVVYSIRFHCYLLYIRFLCTTCLKALCIRSCFSFFFSLCGPINLCQAMYTLEVVWLTTVLDSVIKDVHKLRVLRLTNEKRIID